jgi:hypothetical protein
MQNQQSEAKILELEEKQRERFAIDRQRMNENALWQQERSSEDRIRHEALLRQKHNRERECFLLRHGVDYH